MLLAALVLPLLLNACAIQLVPEFDQALLDGLNETNEAALILFAEVESGASAEEFPQYARRYAELIAGFDSLRQQASARQVPPLAKRLADKKIIRSFCTSASDPAACLNASPASIGEIANTLRQMRDTHRRSGLKVGTVKLFRGRYDIQIDQALTVESALKR
jgi:hypothetical protein